MVHRIDSMAGVRQRGGWAWRDTGDAAAGWWQAPSVDEPEPDSPARVSLARKLERSHRALGRLAYWLFIKGGILVVLLLGLIGLGVIAAILSH
jgi:hypothetical protein